MKRVLFIAVCFALFFLVARVVYVHAQTDTPTPTPSSSSDQVKQLQDQINQYESKISELQGQETSLSSAIKVMDSQIKVTELRIATTEEQISNLQDDVEITKKKISGLETDITTATNAMLKRIAETYRVGREQPWEILLSSNSVANFFTRLKYLQIIQEYDKRTVYAAEQSKVNYSTEQSILQSKQAEEEALQKKLQGYTDEMNKEKADKQTLLTQTQGDEATYQQLLSRARAQLAGFSNFVQSQGGASLLSGQTSCDDWGCYYNQRDSQWGGNSLNGTQYTIASDGCLVTSVAMVYTHYGHRSVTPQTINSNPSNFASYYPAYLLYTVTADGATSNRVGTTIDSNLSAGTPVIVGVHAYGGTHFVVLLSGSSGNYVMNDPYVANGHKINFADHYSMGSIFEIDKVVF